MAQFKSESMPWYDQLDTLRSQSSDATTDELKTAIHVGKSQISDLQVIDKCFDKAALERVRAAIKADPPYTLSYRSAKALAGLTKTKVSDIPGTVHSAIDFILARRLTTLQIEALVEWIAQGNSLETFKEPEAGKKGKTKADKRTTKTKNQSTPTDTTEDLKKVLELSKRVEAEIARGDGETTAQDELRALLKGTVETEEEGNSKGKGGKKSKTASGNPSDWFWEMLLGVKFVSQLRSRAKKGELTTTDKVLVLLYWVVGKPLELIFKFLGKLFKGMAKDFWHWLKHTLGKTFSQIIQWAIPLLIICALIWGAGKVYQYAIVNPLHWVEGEIKSGFHWSGHSEDANGNNNQPLAQPNLVPQLVASAQVAKPVAPHEASVQRPVASTQVYQPSIAFQPADEDPKILQLEIDAMKGRGYVKDFSVSPDEGIPGDVAVSRMRDLADPDKYTMMIGKDKQTVLSVNITTTGLTVNYKSADIFGVVTGGSGQWNVLWEDVKAIHVNEIEVESNSPVTVFQCSVNAEGAKIPLTLQCSTTANLQHLVSTLEYFIRNSRLGHDTALGGMPYLSQGLVLNNDGVVEKLWAQGPMDKAGVTLGDHFWSVGKVTSQQQGKNDLENGLQSLPVTFFTVSPTEWERALTAARVPGQFNSFRPKLRKVILATQQTDKK